MRLENQVAIVTGAGRNIGELAPFDCPVCGDHPTVTTLIDYEMFCGITPQVKSADRGELEGAAHRSPY